MSGERGSVRNAITVDVEEWFQVSNFDRVISRQDWECQPSRVEGSTYRILRSLADAGSRATFFVLGWVAERHPRLLSQIVVQGHEVACHGFGHELVYEIGPQRFREDVREAKARIEDATGRSVAGYRAPSYSITERSLWALRILAEEGFRYDSSIFPTHHPRYGIPGFARHPVRLGLGAGLSIDEYPLTISKIGPLPLPIAGGAYLRFLPGPIFRALFGREVRAGRPTVLYLHPWELDPDQPRIDVGWRIRLNHYANLRRTEGRLRKLLATHPFSPMIDVLADLESSGDLPTICMKPAQNAWAASPFPTAPLLMGADEREEVP